MNIIQERAVIEAALAILDAYEGDYSIGKIATLADLPIDVVSEHVYRAGWKEMGHQYGALGYWEFLVD